MEPKTLVTGGFDLHIWDISRGCLLNSISGSNRGSDQNEFNCIVSTGAGEIAGCSGSKIYFFNIKRKKVRKVVKAHQDSINSLVQYEDYIISASDDGLIKATSIFTHKVTHVLGRMSKWVLSLVASPLHRPFPIFFSGSKKEISIWSLEALVNNQSMSAKPEDNLLRNLPYAHKQSVNKLCLYSDKILISGSRDKSLKVWMYEHDKQKAMRILDEKENAHSDWITSLTVIRTEHGRRIISGDDEGQIKIWKLTKRFGTLEENYRVQAHSSTISGIIGLSKQRFCTGSYDQNIKIFNILGRQCQLRESQVLEGDLNSAVLSLCTVAVGRARKGLDLRHRHSNEQSGGGGGGGGMFPSLRQRNTRRLREGMKLSQSVDVHLKSHEKRSSPRKEHRRRHRRKKKGDYDDVFDDVEEEEGGDDERKKYLFGQVGRLGGKSKHKNQLPDLRERRSGFGKKRSKGGGGNHRYSSYDSAAQGGSISPSGRQEGNGYFVNNVTPRQDNQFLSVPTKSSKRRKHKDREKSGRSKNSERMSVSMDDNITRRSSERRRRKKKRKK